MKPDTTQAGGALPTTSVWRSKEETPTAKGWYITRSKESGLQWRAWGNGGWWKQLKDGWLEWFDGDGKAVRYDWMPRSRKSIDLNQDQLPEVAEYLLVNLQRTRK